MYGQTRLKAERFKPPRCLCSWASLRKLTQQHTCRMGSAPRPSSNSYQTHHRFQSNIQLTQNSAKNDRRRHGFRSSRNQAYYLPSVAHKRTLQAERSRVSEQGFRAGFFADRTGVVHTMRQIQSPEHKKAKLKAGIAYTPALPSFEPLRVPTDSPRGTQRLPKSPVVKGNIVKLPTVIRAQPTESSTETLITSAGGIFVGERQLRKLGIITPGTSVSAIPRVWSEKFLTATNPLRREPVAKNIIFGYDPETQKLYCFEKSLVPGSISKEGNGMPGPEQDKLLLDSSRKARLIEGLMYTSPADHRPILRVLNSSIKVLCSTGTSPKHLPFFGEWGRTADVVNADPQCRVLVGFTSRDGALISRGCNAHYANYARLGLLGSFEAPPSGK